VTKVKTYYEVQAIDCGNGNMGGVRFADGGYRFLFDVKGCQPVNFGRYVKKFNTVFRDKMQHLFPLFRVFYAFYFIGRIGGRIGVKFPGFYVLKNLPNLGLVFLIMRRLTGFVVKIGNYSARGKPSTK
jgi:hypothetical protein